MAIYKPTDCSPFNGTFDLSADLPIIFECKIDTSNSPVTGYSIEIYNSNDEIIFPGVNRTTGPIKNNVTYLTDLKKYVTDNFSSLLPNLKNINSGLNGSYLEIPFYVKEIDTKVGSTVSRNQMSGKSTPNLVEGQTYTWKITLYQEVKKGDSVSATTDNSIFPPNYEKYYDMTVTSGTVIGSNEKRIQTALIDIDDKVVDNLVLIDKFIQPIKIDELKDYSPSNPVTSWAGTVPTTFTMARSLITGYDSTYGYVYPSTAEGNAFADGQIIPENANGFQIFKNGNDPSNLGATDMIDFIYDSGEFEGEMTWKTSAANSEQSYWEQTYLVDSDPGGVFYPLTGDGYSSFALTGSERIIFNNIQDSKVQYGGIYYGSPYNGIFEPHFSSKKTDGETSDYQVTVIWNRTTDAANWGTLSNKIVYCRRDGKNYEINTTTQVGEINKTPFKFVEEKPVRIFKTATVETQNQITGDDSESNPRIFHTDNKISSILSVTNNKGVDVTKDCAFEVGKNYIIYTSSSTIPSNLTISVKYIPFDIRDYTGIIFYNKQATSNQDTGIIYIRPSININKNMIFKEVTTTTNPTWFNINYFNKDYNYITYTGNQGFSPEIDKTRYQIKSFYKDSDYNPFSIYKNPEIKTQIEMGDKIETIKSDGVVNNVDTMNFTVRSNYAQNSYIQWKSYQWILYDSAKRTILEKTEESYSGEIFGSFYGLEPQQYYILSLILQTNSGKIIEVDYVIYTDFTEATEQRDLVRAEFDCDTLSMKASLKFLDVVLAPDADQYLPGTPPETEGTDDALYYYNSKSDFYKKNKQTIASVDDNGVLTITGQNSLDFSKSFENYAINSDTRTGPIQIDADEIVVEGSFEFSEDYNGDIFSVSRGEEGTGTIKISIPEAIKSIDPDGFVTLSDDINKVQIGPNSYLRIIDNNGIVSNSNEWQDSSEFHNTSIWQVNGAPPSGNRINVANFKYAEIEVVVNQNDTPYPYEKGTTLETINGESIVWNQILQNPNFSNTMVDTRGYVDFMVQHFASPYEVFFNQNLQEPGLVSAVFTATASGECRIKHNGADFDIIFCYFNSVKNHKYYIYFNFTSTNPTVVGGVAYNKAQLFDLTQMFGAGKEPATSEDFWAYFETNKCYLKNTYLNITGPFNTNSSEAIRNPMGNNQQLFSFYDSKGVAMQCKKDLDGDQLVPFQINQPDKLIWVDNAPVESPKNVVINANESDVTSAPRSVLSQTALTWNDNVIWKDGTYLENGTGLSAKIGEIRVNGTVIEVDTISGTNPTYTNTGLVKQEKVSTSIKERKDLSEHNLSFRIFINTNNFTIDRLRSACYVNQLPKI